MDRLQKGGGEGDCIAFLLSEIKVHESVRKMPLNIFIVLRQQTSENEIVGKKQGQLVFIFRTMFSCPHSGR